MYTTEQATKILGYANSAVIRLMIKQGRIRAIKFGNHVWMISEQEIKRLQQYRNKKLSTE